MVMGIICLCVRCATGQILASFVIPEPIQVSVISVLYPDLDCLLMPSIITTNVENGLVS